MLIKEFDYNGSSALKPKRKGLEPKRKRNTKKKNNIDKKKKFRYKQKKTRNAVFQVAILILILGFITITRDVRVYSIQGKITKINNDIKILTNENEALQVELLKVNSLEKIVEIAKDKLKMVNPTNEEKINLED